MWHVLRALIEQRPVSMLLLWGLALMTVLASGLKSFGWHADYVKQLEFMVGSDLHLHALLALSLTLVVYRVLSATYASYQGVLFAGGIVAIGCMVDEALQAFAPLRTFSLLDILASLMGVMSASLCNAFWVGWRQRKPVAVH
ncbi:VanZ family protein [Vibrio misgurnus]|uniref:VanZ family protein n=1 Tax=Vibrio misgurnus TaxID=2993714 RepID=UPI0023F9F5FE|nr:VanZ family protein [Vibrio sp. VCS]